MPPHGAFRGFGAPQSIFALERQMDHVARTVGLSPEEFRRRNFIHEGETTATSQIIRERVDLNGLLDRALKLTDYHAKRERFAQQNGNGVKSGIGFATFMHGAGFTGSGEVYLQSVVSAEATAEGKVRIFAASTEIGQGTNTIFSQIAAEALGLDFESIEIVQPDTGLVPNSGPTVASRTSMVVGKLVESAVLGLKQTLIGAGLLREAEGEKHLTDRKADFRNACAEYISTHGLLKTSATYQPPPNVHWDDEKYQGDAYGAYAWAVYVAEVSFDQLTYEAHVEDFVALQEVGRVLNPTLAAGQIEGGVAQAIGFTLFENVVWKDGRMANNQMTNYIIPTPADIPPIRVYFEENPYAYGPGGAKGIGELPMDGAAPAILNAIENATGVSFNRVPLMPEVLMGKFVS
jgi:CO/xanthine dehydrogenase Mo-binding subunit